MTHVIVAQKDASAAIDFLKDGLAAEVATIRDIPLKFSVPNRYSYKDGGNAQLYIFSNFDCSDVINECMQRFPVVNDPEADVAHQQMVDRQIKSLHDKLVESLERKLDEA